MANGSSSLDRSPAGLPQSRLLGLRLPLLIVLAMVSLVGIFLWAASREVERALIGAGQARAANAAGKVATILERSARQTIERWSKAVSHPAVRACVETRAPASCELARVQLPISASGAPGRIELWDVTGRRLLDIPEPSPTGAPVTPPVPPPGTRPATAGPRPFRAVAGTLFFDIVTEIKNDEHTVVGVPAPVLGFVVAIEPVTIDPPGALGRQVGSDATVAIGDLTGGVWSDLSRTVEPPPRGMLSNDRTEFRAATGEARVGAVAAVQGTPWAVWVHFPRSLMVAPALNPVGRMSLVALVVVGIGALLVAGLSVGITRPLLEAQALERSRALHSLQAREAHYRAILEVAFDGIVTIDSRGRVTEFNTAAERTFGYQKAEVLGRELAELILPPRERDAHRSRLASYQATAQREMPGQLVEIVGMHKDGSEFPVELALTAFRTGESVMITGMLRNITERKRMEDTRLRAVATEEHHRRRTEANRLKGEFLANMSHEMRTPLSAIIGFSEFMHSGKAGPLLPDQRAYLADILTSSRHLLQIITDVLDLAKVEAGKMEVRPEAIDLRAVAGEVRDVLRGLASAKGVQMEVDVDPSVAVVTLDPASVKQILYNYLSNAIKFTPAMGQINVRVTPEEPATFRISVHDTGEGIGEEDLPRLFVEFQQLNTSGTRSEGTGLGLVLTKRIAEALGGHVGVWSARGKGSTFWVVLPRALRQPPESFGAHAPSARG